MKRRVRLILDSGIRKTYLTQQLKETLGLKTIARERLCIKTLGSDNNNLETIDVVNVCLKNVNNDVTFVITAHVGPVEKAPNSDTHSVNLAATHVLRIDTHRDAIDVCIRELDEKLHTFWKLESI